MPRRRTRLIGLLVIVMVTPTAWDLTHAQESIFDRARDFLGGTVSPFEGSQRSLPVRDIAQGLQEALRVGTGRVIDQVGQLDGFNADPAIHIPLPKSLRTVQSALGRMGMEHLAGDLETRLNRAAERAAPEAKDVFFEAISQMTLEDVRRIYRGPDDAATQYFRNTMSDDLATRFAPIIEQSLSEVGAIRAYDQMIGQYARLPFLPDVKADLTTYVVKRALDGIFHYIAKEEAQIRHDPAARTTELLKKVFGRP